jgi:FkbM family methyltransferase
MNTHCVEWVAHASHNQYTESTLSNTPLDGLLLRSWYSAAAAVAPDVVKHWAKLVLRPEYRHTVRELRRLRKVGRRTTVFTTLFGEQFEIPDALCFSCMYEDIFENEVYRFTCSKDSPRIIDCGANIGLSVCYFKRRFPKSQVIAFEPDPNNFAVLRRNCQAFSWPDVELVPKAVWTCEGRQQFAQEGTVAGRLVSEPSTERVVEVPTCRLKDYLDRRTHFLKIDIEGAETEVLLDCADSLGEVDNLFVEYHSFVNRPQNLDQLLGVLARAGFRIHIHSVGVSPQPFVRRVERLGMDLYLNIFAFRS